MDLGLSGRTAIVTGASRGIGAATARLLLAEGCRVALVARDGERLAALAAALDPSGARVAAVAADLAQPAGAERAAAAARDALGPLDLLVNCAGSSRGGSFWSLPDAAWEESLALKFLGTMRMLRAVLPDMVARRAGRVVTVIGNSGRQPSPAMLPGATANAALLALTKGLADEVAPHGVVMNAVSPGPTRTERWSGLMQGLAEARGGTAAAAEAEFAAGIPLGRLAEPEEIARLIVLLCSPVTANMVGVAVTADGGATRALA